MKPRILLQLDTDQLPSSFDAVVALDAGTQHLLQYASVDPKNVVGLVHGAIFTRGPADLHSTAIFIGGSDLDAGEAVLKSVCKAMFDPLRVSVVLDSNGANSTACAAVLSAMQHVDLNGKHALVLAATGAVGKRVCLLLAKQNARLSIASRSRKRAEAVAESIQQHSAKGTHFECFDYDSQKLLSAQLETCEVIISCGAAGIELLSATQLAKATNLKVAIDLNAVPPVGLTGIKPNDKAVRRGERFDFGALGVGGLKMKIHKAAIAAAFEKNDQVIDATEMLAIGQTLLQK